MPRLIDYSDDLEQIIDGFPNDAAILSQAASCLYAAARYGRALCVLDQAVQLRPDSPELLWQRASYRRRVNMTRGAVADLLHLLDVRGPQQSQRVPAEEDELEELALDHWETEETDWRFDFPEEFRDSQPVTASFSDYSDTLLHLPGIDPYVASAVWQLRQLSPEAYAEAKRKPVVTALSPEVQARLFAESLLPRQEDDPHDLIRAQKWKEAVDLLGPRLEQSDSWPLDDGVCLFLALGRLGEEDELRKCALKVKDRFRAIGRKANLPTLQMIALVYWKAGDRERADRILRFIDEKAPAPARPIFSYCRFTRVSWKQFKEDGLLLQQIVRGATLWPPFFGKERAGR